MYLNFYGLSKEPFHITPDPDFLFMSPSHQEALAALIYGVEQRKGFISLTGEVGTGKTTILRAYLKEIENTNTQTIYLFNPDLTFESLLVMILGEMGVETKGRLPAQEMLKCLHKELIREYKGNRNVVLLVDEAQNMPDATLEALRMLSNLETTTDKLIQIVLVGQPELDRKLRRFSLRQLRARIAVRARIRPLTSTESKSYIHHRLAQAGSSDVNLFTPTATRAIIKYAKGNPRAINILCDNALVTGYGSGRRPITRKRVYEVIDDLEDRSPSSPLRWFLAMVASFVATGFLIVLLVQMAAKDVIPPSICSSFVSALQEKIKDQKTSIPPQPPKPVAGLAGTVRELSKTPPVVSAPPTSGAAETPPKPPGEAAGAAPSSSPSGTAERPPESPGGAPSVPSPPPSEVAGKVPAPQESPAGVATLPSPPPDAERIAVQATRVVLKGDHLVGLITGVYGRCDNDLIALVRHYNPSIQNPDLLTVGTELIFPKADAAPPMADTTASVSTSGAPANGNPMQ